MLAKEQYQSRGICAKQDYHIKKKREKDEMLLNKERKTSLCIKVEADIMANWIHLTRENKEKENKIKLRTNDTLIRKV
jgi:hypothetical protein